MLLKNTNKEVEELLKILDRKTDEIVETTIELKTVRTYKKRPKRTMVFRSKKVYKFIKENKLKPGKKYLEAFILYYFFLEWCRNRKNKLAPTSYRNFTDIMSLYFPRKFSATEMVFYGITKNFRLSTLTQQKEAAIRRYYNDKSKRKKK